MTTKMSKKMTIRHGPILEIAKQIVERTVFWKKGKVFIIRLFYSYMLHYSSLTERSEKREIKLYDNIE